MKTPENLTKLYYSIGEVASMFDVNASLIRYWESEFSELSPRKSRNGDRQFTVKDIEKLTDIYNLVKDRGFTIDGARQELKNVKKFKKQLEPIQKKLKQIKGNLEKLKKNLE